MINWTSYLFSNSKLIYRRKIKIHILIKTIKSITNITILKIMIVWSGKIQLTLSLKNFHNLFANYYFPSSNEIWWSAFSRNSCVPLDAEKKKVKGRQDESSSEGRGGKRRRRMDGRPFSRQRVAWPSTCTEWRVESIASREDESRNKTAENKENHYLWR